MTNKPEPPDAKSLSDLFLENAGVILDTAAIGQVAVAAAALELAIDRCSIELAGIANGPGHCFTSQIMGPMRKLDAYSSVAHGRGLLKNRSQDHKHLLAEPNKMYEAIRISSERRNRVIHDPWLFEEGKDAQRWEITARRVLVNELKPIKSAEIVKIARELGELAKNFGIMHKQILELLATSPGTPPEASP